MKFYSNFNKPKQKFSDNLDYKTKMVSQAEADVCGLKYQLERYGMNTLMSKFEAMKSKFGYADCRNIPDFETMQNRVVSGTQYFDNLPSEIRQRFNNKAAIFYSYIENNPVEAVKEGYINNSTADYIKTMYPERFKSSESFVSSNGQADESSDFISDLPEENLSEKK